MLDLDALIAALPARPDPALLLRGFVPPARFAGKRFSTYDPRHPSQEAALRRLQQLDARLAAERRGGLIGRVRAALGRGRGGGGVYLDGGFGVGKTHLLAALWNAAPAPKAYLSFDELVQCTPWMREPEFRRLFLAQRLVCVDEWELDDPGNLTLALSVLRDMLEAGVRVATTSNTLPLELGAGRFNQKDFVTEIAELAGAFEVVTLTGDDYRHRHFQLNPSRECFLDRRALLEHARAAGANALLVPFERLLDGLRRVHPLRYSDLLRGVGELFVEGFGRVSDVPDALRLVHFVDKLYNAEIPLAASSEADLGALFPPAFVAGPYGKKCMRCISRLEELLGEGATPRAYRPHGGARSA